MSASSETVVLTGASGFIGMHLAHVLLGAGYRVRAAVRSEAKAALVRQSLAGTEGLDSRLQFHFLDLTSDEGWEAAFSGASYAVHTASPVPNRPPKNRDEVIGPALEGVNRALRFAHQAKLRRLVMTSSVAAIVSGQDRPSGRVFTEQDWSQLTPNSPAYDASKTLGEQAAWEFAEQHELELTVLNPAYVLGPSLGGVDNASNEIVRKPLDRELPGVPKLIFPTVDVRDVAEAHLQAMIRPQAAGKRFILCADHPHYIDIVRILKSQGHAVPLRELPTWLVHVASWFDPILRLVTEDLDKDLCYCSARAEEVLGFAPRPLELTLKDTAESILSRRE